MMNLRIKANKRIKNHQRIKNNKILTHKNSKILRISNKNLAKNRSNKTRTLIVMILVLKVIIHLHHHQMKIRRKAKKIILHRQVILVNLRVKVKNKK